MARADLEAELARPGFTPGRGDVPALVELVIAGNERAIAALGGLDAAAAIAERIAGAEDGAAARLVQTLGLVARGGDADARARLIALVGEPRVRVRKAAIVALGKLGALAARVELREAPRREGPRRTHDAPVVVELRDGDTRRTAQRRDDDDVRAVLLARWDHADLPPEERRALAEALGKLGGTDAIARLRALDGGDDKELVRLRDRALLMADRTERRDEPSSIAIDVAPPYPLAVSLTCRPQLGALLGEELAQLGIAAQARPEGARLELRGPWSTLHASRLWERAAILVPLVDGNATRTLTSERVLSLLRAWTRGPIRWRLEAAPRAQIWKAAKAVTAAAPELINDPTATTWEIQATDTHLVLVPRRIDDPRFAYRVAEVPAASHGSVAAALVFAARVAAGDRVWDPFCGSGVELVEAARRGVTALVGSDLDAVALDAARANLAAAGVTAELALADARTHAAGPVDAIITNPPLGSRVHVDAGALLVAALPSFARALVPGGRLVWITPAPRKTTPAAEQLGLVLDTALPVDLGGVRGRLERWNKPRG